MFHLQTYHNGEHEQEISKSAMVNFLQSDGQFICLNDLALEWWDGFLSCQKFWSAVLRFEQLYCPKRLVNTMYKMDKNAHFLPSFRPYTKTKMYMLSHTDWIASWCTLYHSLEHLACVVMVTHYARRLLLLICKFKCPFFSFFPPLFKGKNILQEM